MAVPSFAWMFATLPLELNFASVPLCVLTLFRSPLGPAWNSPFEDVYIIPLPSGVAFASRGGVNLGAVLVATAVPGLIGVAVPGLIGVAVPGLIGVAVPGLICGFWSVFVGTGVGFFLVTWAIPRRGIKMKAKSTNKM